MNVHFQKSIRKCSLCVFKRTAHSKKNYTLISRTLGILGLPKSTKHIKQKWDFKIQHCRALASWNSGTNPPVVSSLSLGFDLMPKAQESGICAWSFATSIRSGAHQLKSWNRWWHCEARSLSKNHSYPTFPIYDQEQV